MSLRRGILLFLGLMSLVLVSMDARADRGGFVIRRFHTDLEIQADASLIVQERLEVDFLENRHGIYREIPIRYTDRLGYQYSLGLKMLAVVDENGAPHTTKVTRKGRHVSIRIGDAGRTVRGLVTYILRYRVEDALGNFEDHDELYWNATGNEWRARIEEASAAVHLPTTVPSDGLDAAGYSGRLGSREQDVRVRYPAPGRISYEKIGALEPLEGLTIVAVWPKGHVAFPSQLSCAGRLIGDNWIGLAPFGALAFLWRRYRRGGRDPQGPAAVMVRYEPPRGMTPGEIGTLVDEKVDMRDITATLVDLAVRGYLKIAVAKKSRLFGLGESEETSFERLGDQPDADLHPHETILLNGLFASGDKITESDLKQKFYQKLPGIRDALYERLDSEGYFAGKPSTVRQRFAGFGIAAGIAALGVGLIWAQVRGGIFPQAAILPIVAGVLTAALFLSFAPAMPRRTRRGVQMRSWAQGFEEFVDRVEREKIDRSAERNVFESLLPYAMALGVAAKWADKFEGIYEQESPGWYVGPHHGAGFSTRSLEQGLTSSMNNTAQGMAASPRSSGAGGGGFSGGGGGGGGGGSW